MVLLTSTSALCLRVLLARGSSTRLRGSSMGHHGRQSSTYAFFPARARHSRDWLCDRLCQAYSGTAAGGISARLIARISAGCFDSSTPMDDLSTLLFAPIKGNGPFANMLALHAVRSASRCFQTEARRNCFTSSWRIRPATDQRWIECSGTWQQLGFMLKAEATRAARSHVSTTLQSFTLNAGSWTLSPWDPAMSHRVPR